MKKLDGVYVAVVTPFENGMIAESTYARHLENLIASGISGIVVCGSTGESSMLSMEEHVRLIALSRQIVKERIQVIANAGSNSTEEAIYLAMAAEESGVDYILSVVPYYVKPTQEGLYLHFKAVHDAVKNTPVIIYNVPGRTVVDISVDTVVRLSKLDRCMGIKEASSDMEKVSNLVANTPADFSVLSGNDPTFLPLLSVGGNGVISVIGNIMPKEQVEMYRSFRAGNLKKAIEINKKMLPLYKALSFESNPIPVKYALYKMVQINNELKPPLTSLSESYYKKYDQILKDLNLI